MNLNISDSLSNVSSLLSRLTTQEGLSRNAATVLIHLAAMIYYTEGRASNKLLAEKSRLSERTITSLIEYLEYKKFISVNNITNPRTVTLLRVDIFIEELDK